jgi:WD40 repeat protein/energy-coupling factor transporter ATP-binding protein EcfA2
MSKTNPFPGLRPFQPNESHLFFGRENHIKEILRKLNNFRFVSIVGNSGSGKSSLVRAGVLPRIMNDNENSWRICVMRPGKDPVSELCEALFDAEVFGSTSEPERKLQLERNNIILRKNTLGLVQVVRPLIPSGKRLLILVDQFEEIFRFNNMYESANKTHEASYFVDLLLASAGQKDVPIYVVMTIRTDFLGDCEQFSGLPEAINDGQFLIPRMNKDEIQLSITGPIDAVAGKISPRLVQNLVREVGNSPDQLPILQHVLMRTWAEWENVKNPGIPIDLEHYESTGGMAKALSNHAEEAYSDLITDKKRKLAETLFKTITLKGGDNRGVRRPTQIGKIAEIAEAKVSEIVEVVNIFRSGDRGFIMPPISTEINEGTIVDISHESLMRVWVRLGDWVEEEGESAELYNRITESSLLYDKEMAGLWRDPDLQIAVAWRVKNKPNKFWANQYNSHFELAMRFVDASIQDKNFLRAEIVRKKKIVNAVLISFGVILSLLSLWAFNERNNSIRNANAAISQQQIAEKQKANAEQQKVLAEQNLTKAEKEEKRAKEQELEANRQGKLALQKAEEAKLEKLKAERASLKANEARKAAELDRQIAQLQKSISDSLRQTAEISQQNAYRLRILSLAQNLAIKSKLADKSTYSESVKTLLALQAFKFHKKYNGKDMDPEIFGALFSALRLSQEKNAYVFSQHADVIKSICFDPVSDLLASAGNDGILCVNNTGIPGSASNCSKGMPLIFDNLAYNKSGTKIANSCDNRKILIFDIGNLAAPEKQIQGLHPQEIMALAWDGDRLISACLDMNIRIIDPNTSKVLQSYTIESKPISISFDEANRLLYVGCENGGIYKLGLTPDSKPEVFKQISKGRVTCLDLNRDGTLLVYGTGEGSCGILKTKDQTAAEIIFHGHKAGITNIHFNRKTNQVSSSCLDGMVRLWNADISGEPPIVFSEHDSWVMSVDFNSTGNLMASSGKDKTVRLYPIVPSEIADRLEKSLSRSFTKEEWNSFIGNDIPYEKTVGK